MGSRLLCLVLCLLSVLCARAHVSCTADADCSAALYAGSTCANGRCTNPFSSGCLRRRLGSNYAVRVCNSDDTDEDLAQGLCRKPKFNYTEIRVAGQDWESSIFIAWILQILLSERLEVPVTIESGSASSVMNFYDPSNSFGYGAYAYDWDAMREGDRTGDCTKSTTGRCAMYMPEVWIGQNSNWVAAEAEGYIDAVEGNGEVGKLSWFIPKWVANQDPTLISYFGLRGEPNRQKLASTFKQPTNWLTYCQNFSSHNCSATDPVAIRWPTSSEESMYFSENLFDGYFRHSNTNNCTLNPTTCVGHIVSPPCTWSNYMDGQIYWNDIFLQSSGPLEPHLGYTYSQMQQIWNAANKTRSPVIMWWWTPDATVQLFEGTDSEFQPVILPTPTPTCTNNRVNVSMRCSTDPVTRRGSSKGSCDSEAHALRKIIVSRIRNSTFEAPVALRSPAYEMLKGFTVSDIEMAVILKAWVDRGVDRWNYDARHAVCEWVSTHIEDLERYFPPGYPRSLRTTGLFNAPYIYAAQAVAGFVILLVVAVAILVYRKRQHKIMVYSQVQFMFLILVGFLLVTISSVIYVLEPSLVTCTTRFWLLTVGYTIHLVPLLVKVAAVNKIFGEKKLRRVKLTPRYLFGIVALVVFVVILYLTIWTAIDPMNRRIEFRLVGEATVEASQDCASNHPAWLIGVLIWESILLLTAAALAFQGRNVRLDFNESRSLFSMVYTHFIALGLKVLLFALSEVFSAPVRAMAVSLVISIDTVLTLCVYFGPKLVAAMKPADDATPRHLSSSGTPGGASWHSASRDNSSHGLKQVVSQGKNPGQKPKEQEMQYTYSNPKNRNSELQSSNSTTQVVVTQTEDAQR